MRKTEVRVFKISRFGFDGKRVKILYIWRGEVSDEFGSKLMGFITKLSPCDEIVVKKYWRPE